MSEAMPRHYRLRVWRHDMMHDGESWYSNDRREENEYIERLDFDDLGSAEALIASDNGFGIIRDGEPDVTVEWEWIDDHSGTIIYRSAEGDEMMTVEFSPTWAERNREERDKLQKWYRDGNNP